MGEWSFVNCFVELWPLLLLKELDYLRGPPLMQCPVEGFTPEQRRRCDIGQERWREEKKDAWTLVRHGTDSGVPIQKSESTTQGGSEGP